MSNLNNTTDFYKYFFGGNPNGKVFVKAFLSNNFDLKYKNDISLEQDAIMTYAYRQNETNKRENSIHPEFTNFLIGSGMVHKEMDTPSTHETSLGVLVESLGDFYNANEEKINKYVLDNLNSFDSVDCNAFSQMFTKGINFDLVEEISKPKSKFNKNDFMANITTKTTIKCSQFKELLKLRPVAASVEEDIVEVSGFVDQLKNIVMSEMKLIIKSQYYDAHTTLLRSNYSKKLIDNVYKKWNTVPTKQQHFYNNFMTLLKRNNENKNVWEPIPENQYMLLDVTHENMDNYRINLNKEFMGSTISLWEGVLKKIPIKQRKIFINAQNGTISKLNVTNLGDVYKMGFSHDIDNKLSLIGSAKSDFEIDIKKLVHKLSTVIRNTTTPRKYIEYNGPIFDIATQGIWFKAEDGYVKNIGTNAKPNFLRYGVNDDRFKVMMTRQRCYSTMVNANSEQCNKYLYECLLNENGNDIDTCLAMRHLNRNFYDVSKKEINEMHPQMALMIMKKFGFTKYKSMNEILQTELYAIEDIKHWQEHHLKHVFLSKYLNTSSEPVTNPTDKLSEAKNTQEFDKFLHENRFLISYLGMVVDFINNQPGLLNEDEFKVMKVSKKTPSSLPTLPTLSTSPILSTSQTPHTSLSKEIYEDEYFFEKLSKLPSEWDIRRDSVELGCPPFMIGERRGPDMVCKSAVGYVIKRDEPDRLNKSYDYLKKKTEKYNFKFLFDANMYKMEKLRNLGYDVGDFIAKIHNITIQEETVRDDYLKVYKVLEQFENVCNIFEGYDDETINNANLERLKLVCKKKVFDYKNLRKELVTNGEELEKNLRVLQKTPKMNKKVEPL
jgi:hypothetical protein